MAVQPAERAEVKGIQPRQDLEPEDQMLTTDQVADVIAAVRKRAAAESDGPPRITTSSVERSSSAVLARSQLSPH